jgi:hypothetical protein
MKVAAPSWPPRRPGSSPWSARPALFLGAGLAVFLTATAAGVALATRRRPRQPRRQRVVAFVVGTLAGVAVSP